MPRAVNKLMKRIALERMNILFNLGIKAIRDGDYELGHRYGELIYRISMKVRVKIPRRIKRWICKNCHTIIIPGLNAMVRTRSEGKTLRIITHCLVCGWIHRYEFLRCRKDGETQGIS